MRVSRPNRDIAGKLTLLIHELIAPYTHKQLRRIGWKYKNRTGAKYKEHKTVHPPLLAQLDAAIRIRPQTDQLAAVKATSTDPTALPHFDAEAFDRKNKIAEEVLDWCVRLGERVREVRGRPIDTSLRLILGRLHTLDQARLRELLADVGRWHTWCEIMSGWKGAPVRPNVPCPACGATPSGERKGLRVRMAAASGTGGVTETASVQAAVCLSCETTWSADTIGILAEHMRREGREDA